MLALRRLGKKVINDNKRTFSNGDVSKGSGAFGRKEHAQEEQYFRQKEQEEIQELKKELKKKGKPTKKDKDSDEDGSNKK